MTDKPPLTLVALGNRPCQVRIPHQVSLFEWLLQVTAVVGKAASPRSAEMCIATGQITLYADSIRELPRTIGVVIGERQPALQHRAYGWALRSWHRHEFRTSPPRRILYGSELGPVWFDEEIALPNTVSDETHENGQ